ncbi:hypothetical protein D3C76_875260 [compost metagenome]
MAGQLEAGAAGGAADVQRALVVAAQLAGEAGQGAGVVGYPEVGRAVLEVEVLRHERVGFIRIHDNGFLITGDQIAEARMLEEVAAEGVAGRLERLVASAYPAAALDEGVLAIEGGGGEVVVERMHLEPLEAVDGGAGPLPDVAHQIEEAALRKGIYRTGRREAGQVEVAGCLQPVRLIPGHLLAQQRPLSLARQLDGQPGLGRFPAAEGGSFQLVYLHRPVPGQGNLLGHQPQLQLLGLAGVTDPEAGHARPGILAPAPALVVPPGPGLVAARLHEGEVLGVAHQHAAGLEGGQLYVALAIFVVPAVGGVLFAEPYPAARHRQQAVGGHLVTAMACFGTGGPIRLWLHPGQGQLADQHAGGLQVDALVLYPHQDDPGRALPVDGQCDGHTLDEITHQGAHAATVVAQFGYRGPVVVGLVQIVPAHLVHPYGHHGLDAGVEAALDEARRQQLVDEEGGGVAVVEDEGVAQGDRLVEPGPLVGQAVKQAVVEIEGLTEVVEQLAALVLGIVASEQRGAGRGWQALWAGEWVADLGHALTPCWQ